MKKSILAYYLAENIIQRITKKPEIFSRIMKRMKNKNKEKKWFKSDV